MREFRWRRALSGLLLVAMPLLAAALIVPYVLWLRDEARKTQSRDNLHSIGLALENYHHAHSAFPPGGVIGEDGTAFHGWYTQILPYVDSSPLYSSIDRHLSWDHPRNVHLFRTSISVCLVPGIEEVATAEGFGLIHYQGNPNVFHRNSHVGLGDLIAGTENSWLAGEAAGQHQPWGYPFNWRPLGRKLNSGPRSFGRPTGDGAYLLMGDRSVRFVANNVGAEVLAMLRDSPPVAEPEQTASPNRSFEYQP